MRNFIPVILIAILFVPAVLVAEVFVLSQALTTNQPGFGAPVALDGNTALVGAPGNAGSASLLNIVNGEVLQTFDNPNPSTSGAVETDFYAESSSTTVALSGGRVLISAEAEDIAATDSGAVYLFDAGTGDLLRTFTHPSPVPELGGAGFGQGFGREIALNGDYVLVSTTADEAFLFDVVTGDLLRTFPGPSPGSLGFGSSTVALSDQFVAIGDITNGTGATSAGAVQLFDKTTGGNLQTLFNPTPSENDFFGEEIAIDGNRVFIGAGQVDVGGVSNAGEAYLFDAITGQLLHTLVDPTPNSNAFFGRHLDIEGDFVVVASQGDNEVHIFDAVSGELLQTLTEQSVVGLFGRSVVLDQGKLLVGTPFGSAFLYTVSVPDDFDDSKAIGATSFKDTVDTSSASTEPSDPTPSCGGGSRDNSVWYQFTPQTSGTIHLDTLESDYDTVVSVWTGAPGSFTQVACNDDVEASSGGGSLVLAQTVSAGNSSVSFPANGGTTYFIMVSGKGGGGGLTISLAFQASSDPLPPNTVDTIIPHSALGGGFLSRVFITNLSNNLNRIVINRVGQPGSVIDSASTFLEPAATAQVAASEAARTGDLTIEWFTIGSEADVASSLLFEFDSASLGLEENFRTAVGTLAAESLSAFTVPVRVATVEVTVGLALADLSGSSNTVNLTLRDEDGATVAQDSLTLAAFEQTAFSLQDRAAFSDIILGVPEFIGSLAVETANPNQSVAAIVIGNNLRQLYALPVIPGVASSSGSTLRVPSTRSMVTRSRPAPGLAQAIPAGNFTTLIPHSAAGGGFLSRLFVVNLTGNTNNLTINRIGQDGSVVTTTDAMLAPAGTLMLPDEESVRSEDLTIEWFAIGSDMPVGASLLFEFDSTSLGLEENFLTAVGSLAAEPLSSFTTPIRVATVDVTAGVALANPNDASTTVNLTLINQGGMVVAQDSITLGAFQQTAFSLQDRAAFSDIILGVPEFVGALAVTTTDANLPVAALVIGNNLGQLFALPVTPGVAQ